MVVGACVFGITARSSSLGHKDRRHAALSPEVATLDWLTSRGGELRSVHAELRPQIALKDHAMPIIVDVNDTRKSRSAVRIKGFTQNTRDEDLFHATQYMGAPPAKAA